MKEFVITLALGLVAIVGLIVIVNLDAISAGMIALGQLLYTWLKWTLAALTAGGLAAGSILFYFAWMERHARTRRPVDGSFPLQQFKRDGVTVLVDPNKMVSAAGVFHPDIGWRELDPAAGWDRQTLIAQAVQTTRTAEALAPGDDAIRHMPTYRPPSIPSQIIRPAPPKKTSLPPMPDPDQTIDVPPARIEPQNQIDHAQPTRLVLGQETEGPANLAHWNLGHFPFLRIHGATQSGKSSLGRFLATQALKHGYEVVIYDRRRGKDWNVFRSHAEIYDVRRTDALIHYLEQEVARYQERDALLGQHGATNLADLAAKTGRAYRRRLIIIEELGIQHVNAQSEGRATYSKMTSMLARLTSEAGATGIHGLYLDQMPVNWDKRLRYNCAAVIFKLSDHGGQVAGYQMAYELDQYHCWFDDAIIRAGWLDEPQIRQALASAQRSPVRPAPTPPPTSGSERRTNAEPNRTANVNSPTVTIQPGQDSDETRQAIYAYLERHPDASQADIRRALSTSKGYTYQCWHEWHGQPTV